VIPSAGHHAVGELVGEKGVISVEPSLGFEEGKKEKSREIE
jgi:hypothetical protein